MYASLGLRLQDLHRENWWIRLKWKIPFSSTNISTAKAEFEVIVAFIEQYLAFDPDEEASAW